MYRSPNGDYPVQQFIDNLETEVQAKVRNTLKLLQEFGIRLGEPHVRKLTDTDLWELRILGRNNLRVFYVAVTSRTFILLHGFIKKKNKTPRKEIKIAEDRLIEYRSRTTK